MPTLPDKFRGCVLGAMLGDIAGAVVEAESPAYIARHYQSIDQILAVDSVEEFSGPRWKVGRYTDDTQMMICVAEWLIAGESKHPDRLLARFVEAYQPWRRYGPSTEGILRLYPDNQAAWRELATASFPHGSFGNGSAMRVAPVGLLYHDDLKKLADVSRDSSRPTHSHPLAYMGATLQAIAVAVATISVAFDRNAFVEPMRKCLAYYEDLLQDTTPFVKALDAIERGLNRGASCMEMSLDLGTGITAHEAVPMALYCFLSHPDSYAKVIHEAVYLGGDTDTIACMAGAIAGAFLGIDAIPQSWRDAVREERYEVDAVRSLADELVEKYVGK